MATSTKIKLTDDQRRQLASDLRVAIEQIPMELGVMAISPVAASNMGLPQDMQSKFAPALIIT